LEPALGAATGGTPSSGTAGTYVAGDPLLLGRLAALADHIEVTPDVLAIMTDDGVDLDPRAIGELRELAADRPVIVHGVGLSIGSYDGYHEGYVRLLDRFLEQVPVAWHSEHLGYTRVGGRFLGTMLPLPKTREVLDMVAERAIRLRERYGLPFLLENVAHLLPPADAELTDAAFLNRLSAETGCGVLLDVYNLRCDEANHGFDIGAFLDELDLALVGEIHVAGGVKHRGFTLDVHSRRMQEPTLARAADVARRAPNVRTVTYEFLQEAVPALGHDAIVGELARLRGALRPQPLTVSG
jgi:uncharacterized protein (UPF0276 family)